MGPLVHRRRACSPNSQAKLTATTRRAVSSSGMNRGRVLPNDFSFSLQVPKPLSLKMLREKEIAMKVQPQLHNCFLQGPEYLQPEGGISHSDSTTCIPGKDGHCRRRNPTDICNKGRKYSVAIEKSLVVQPMIDHLKPESTISLPSLTTLSVGGTSESRGRAVFTSIKPFGSGNSPPGEERPLRCRVSPWG